MKNKKLVCGVGITDITTKNGNEESYDRWSKIIKRCYNPKCHINHPTYIGCSVCDEWKLFSNFKKWFDINNRVGMQIDKDILIRGNKIYSPSNCKFVPQEINKLLNGYDNGRGKYKQGVQFHKGAQKYIAQMSRNGTVHIGTFDTELEAFDAYKTEKELWIKNRADYYYRIGLIGLDIHTALYNWTI